ncbi:MAG: hypothetical protein IPN34_20320 [Planctomycetes bacterium]|nr:hypothetical protein [Planctomycetota bacterium]
MSLTTRAWLGAPLFLLLAASPLAAQAANDICANAIAIPSGVSGPYTNAGANTELVWPCGAGGVDLWFTHTATCNGPISFDTCDLRTNFDTTIEVLTNDCNNPVSLACNDDACGQRSTAIIQATLGTTYLVRVGGYAANRFGTFYINIRCTTLPANDECAGAVTINNGANGPFSSVNATDSGPFPCQATGGSDIWFRYTSTCNGPLAFDTCSANTTFDTVMEVYDGACGTLNPLGCNDDACLATASVVVVPAVTGGVYYVRVGGWSQRQGLFGLNVTCSPVPGNDECTGAIPLNIGANGPFTNLYSSDSQPGWNCAQGGSDVWFTWFANCATSVTVDTCPGITDYDTALEVLDGGCGSLFSVACNDDSCARASSVTFQTTTNTLYYIRVGGYQGLQGNFNVNLSVSGAGSLSTQATGCGTATMVATGQPNLGGSVSFRIDNEVGLPFLWIGLPLGVPLCPPAACTIGATFESIVLGDTLQASIPCDPTLRGGTVLIQGGDFGGSGGCPQPLQLSLTDTIQATIG